MRIRGCLLLSAVALLAGCADSKTEQPTDAQPTPPPVELTAADVSDGWIRLFDGETLFGWQANDADQENAVAWEVQDGMIVADGDGRSLLLTSVPWADFELKFQYRLDKGGNSGVFLRTVPNPSDPATDCYELNFCDTHEQFKTASLVGRTQPSETVSGDGAWQTVRVVMDGPHILAEWNGKKVLDWTDQTDALRLSGWIGLQKNVGKIAFRHLSIKPLNTKPIFNGKDLSGWREVPGSQSKFSVQDGQIHVENGRGYLETEQTWADFVLQASAITHGEHLNSGIFFRALPGTEKNPADGYELQIRHEYKDDDRSQPVDFGTGAIYRRVPTRRVVSNDNEWTHLTLVAHGPHIATWVNGYPTVAWTDTREPHENPRNGLRTEPGHISLQGHDPTTNLDFRNLRIAEYPEVKP